ncbi:Uncharacterised protein [Escherichia coli]|uniref:Uncharacterized protein n=1 Tax=Escherichia coli TaxID=562 RepID=A0A376MNZ6_ECOLX|nr:Uncharacterised protein [Escherichia coli]
MKCVHLHGNSDRTARRAAVKPVTNPADTPADIVRCRSTGDNAGGVSVIQTPGAVMPHSVTARRYADDISGTSWLHSSLSTDFPGHHHIHGAVNHLTVIKHHGRVFLHAQRLGMCHIAVMTASFRLHRLPFGRLHTYPDHRFSLTRISRQQAQKRL